MPLIYAPLDICLHFAVKRHQDCRGFVSAVVESGDNLHSDQQMSLSVHLT